MSKPITSRQNTFDTWRQNTNTISDSVGDIDYKTVTTSASISDTPNLADHESHTINGLPVTLGSPVIDIGVNNFKVRAGMLASSSELPANTSVVSINYTTGVVNLSNNFTATGTSNVTFTPTLVSSINDLMSRKLNKHGDDVVGNFSVSEMTTLNNLTVTGNSTIGNADTDTIAMTGQQSITTGSTVNALTITKTGASGYAINVVSGNEVHGGNVGIGALTAPTATLDVTGTVKVSSTTTVSGNIILNGTAANIATGSNFISNTGTDFGLSFDGSNNAIFSEDVAINGGDVTSTQATFNLISNSAVSTALNIGDYSATISLGKNNTSAKTVVVGGAITGNTLKLAGTASGTVNISSDVTTGIANIFQGVTTGTVNVGSANAGSANVLFNTTSSSPTTGALVVTGGVGIGGTMTVGGNVSFNSNVTLGDAVGDTVTLNAGNVDLINDSRIDNDLMFFDIANRRVGVNNDSPYASFTVRTKETDTANNIRGIAIEHVDNTTAFSQAKFIGSRARGTFGAPTAVLSNDAIVSFSGRARKATAWSNTVGGFYIYAGENWTDTATGTYLTMRGVVAGGTTVSEWVKIESTKTTIHATTAASSTTTGALVVSGGVGVAGNLYTGGDVSVQGGDLLTSQTTFNIIDTTATTINFGGAATTLNVGHDGATASTTNIATGALSSGTKTLNIGTGAAAGTTNVNIGHTVGTTTVNGALAVTGISTFSNDINANANVNLGNANTDVITLAGIAKFTGKLRDSTDIDIVNGVLMTGASAGVPVIRTLQSSDGTISFTYNANNIDIKTSGILPADVTFQANVTFGDSEADRIIYNGFVDGTQKFGLAASGVLSEVKSLYNASVGATGSLIFGSQATYRSVEFFIQTTNGTGYFTTKIMVLHDGTTTSLTEYGTLRVGLATLDFTVDLSGGNIVLSYSGAPATGTTTTKVLATGFRI